MRIIAAWKKWWVALLFLPQLLAGSGVILLWYFQNEQWARLTLNWLATDPGQITLVVIAAYAIFMALATISVAIFRPTTTKQLTVARDGAFHVKVDQEAVEKHLRLALAEYELYNAQAHVKMHRNSQQADVNVSGMLSGRVAPEQLQTDLRATIANSLKQHFNIDLRKLKVNLQPYDYKQEVAII